MGLKIDDYMKREQYKYTTDIFIKKAKEVHCNKYSYANSVYINKRTKINIICPEHGEFTQLPMNHIRGQGCPECGKIIAQKREMNCKNHRKTNDEFQNDLNVLYNGKYELVSDYVNNKTKVDIFCHNKNKNGKEHGLFSIKPNDLICGHGCHKCVHSGLENEIEAFLNENGIEFELQKRFEWLGRQSLDFYIPKYNVAIECQGKQHFKPVDFKGEGYDIANKKFKQINENDDNKLKLCNEHNINIYYYSNDKNYFGDNYRYKIYLDKNELLNKILKNGQ